MVEFLGLREPALPQPTTAIVAAFEISLSRFIDGSGKAVDALPPFAMETRCLAALHRRGFLVVPNNNANAGGVMCGAIEFAGGSQVAAMEAIDVKIRTNTRAVLEISANEGVPPRKAAVQTSVGRSLSSDVLRSIDANVSLTRAKL